MQAALYIAAMPEPDANTGYSRYDLLTRYWQTLYFPEDKREWNILPARTVSAPTLDAFKSLLME